MPTLAPHAADQAVAAAPGREGDRAHHRRACAKAARRPGARARARARARHRGRHHGDRPRDRRSARARRRRRLFRRAPRRPGRHDAGGALARLDPEALHLRSRLRGRADPSRDADRRSPGALRLLRAGELRSHLPGHGLGAQGAADVAQRAGGHLARGDPRQPADRAHHRCGRAFRAAERRGARASRWGWAASASRSPT